MNKQTALLSAAGAMAIASAIGCSSPPVESAASNKPAPAIGSKTASGGTITVTNARGHLPKIATQFGNLHGKRPNPPPIIPPPTTSGN